MFKIEPGRRGFTTEHSLALAAQCFLLSLDTVDFIVDTVVVSCKQAMETCLGSVTTTGFSQTILCSSKMLDSGRTGTACSIAARAISRQATPGRSFSAAPSCIRTRWSVKKNSSPVKVEL